MALALKFEINTSFSETYEREMILADTATAKASDSELTQLHDTNVSKLSVLTRILGCSLGFTGIPGVLGHETRLSKSIHCKWLSFFLLSPLEVLVDMSLTTVRI